MAAVESFLRELLGASVLEAVAVILALLYLVLAMFRSMWCWLCAFVSSVCYVIVMWRAHLVMDTLLSVFYVVMAVYGYWQWLRGQSKDGELMIARWTWRQHALAALFLLLTTAANAWALQFVQIARSPWLDSFVTWGSVLTTFMVARRLIENWLYWIVVDGVAAYLYYSRGLTATALLFVAYVFMVIYGYWVWRRKSAQQPLLTETPA
jgi:nicotinamide mononucleotide transporter